MKNPVPSLPPEERVAREAAAWVLRGDRGLTAPEQDEFSAWLARDPRHGAELARHRRHWQRLDALAAWMPEHSTQPNPDLLAPPLRRLRRAALVLVPLAAAAGLALALWLPQPASTPAPAGIPGSAMRLADSPNQRVLEDGSIIELNRNAAVRVAYSASERRVVLLRGEAHFAVESEKERPFVVQVQGVDVRAVGTAFNVRVGLGVVEVLVTEGKVAVARRPATTSLAPTGARERSAPPAGPHEPLSEIGARQRAVISLTLEAPPPQIATLTPGEIERVLAWQHRLLDFTAAPLSEIVAEFNRRNVVQLVIVDPELAVLRVSAAFRSDNIDGFVRLLEAGFGARAERRGEAEIVLRRAR